MCFPPSLLVSILFHYLCPLLCRQYCLCGRGSLETLWPQRNLKNHLMFCSEVLSGLRGEISLAVPLTTRHWTIEMALPLLTEYRLFLHFPTKICHSNPKIPAAGEQQGDSFFFLICLSSFLSFRHLSLFSLFSGDKFL